jgi:hypothetical protein
MSRAALLTEQQIKEAMSRSLSNRAAARLLNVSFETYRFYAKQYINPDTGLSLFEEHKNQSGKGIGKEPRNGPYRHLHHYLKEGMGKESYAIDKLKDRLIIEGYLAHECSRCGFREHRLIDYKIPLLLYYKNGIKSDWRIENLELLCYNCYFLYIGDVFTKQEQRSLQDFGAPAVQGKVIDFDLDDLTLEQIEQAVAEVAKELNVEDIVVRY